MNITQSLSSLSSWSSASSYNPFLCNVGNASSATGLLMQQQESIQPTQQQLFYQQQQQQQQHHNTPFNQVQPQRRPITGLSNFSIRNKPVNSASYQHVPYNSTSISKFSRKVFVGGLPPDIDEGKN